MPFEIVRNDIVNMAVDAIVNTANPRPVIGSGTDAAIHAKAGPELLEARRRIGRIQAGSAGITPGFGLEAKYVIHTVGPVWRGGLFGEEKKLRGCYDSALRLAMDRGCRSIAFPLISTGNYGFPKEKALKIALSACSEFLMEHEMRIFLVVFDREAFRLSEKLFRGISSYIDEHYVQLRETAEYSRSFPAPGHSAVRRTRDWEAEESEVFFGSAPCGRYEPTQPCPMEPSAPCPPMAAAPKAISLEDMLKQEDAGFSETLLKLIDRRGKKDSQVYKKANLSKQHFSKIRNNPHYQPTKQTAISLALALELDLEQTRDLIGRAGYALSNSSKFDLIIRYFIEQGIYDVVQINIALYEFDQSLLGA